MIDASVTSVGNSMVADVRFESHNYLLGLSISNGLVEACLTAPSERYLGYYSARSLYLGGRKNAILESQIREMESFLDGYFGRNAPLKNGPSRWVPDIGQVEGFVHGCRWSARTQYFDGPHYILAGEGRECAGADPWVVQDDFIKYLGNTTMAPGEVIELTSLSDGKLYYRWCQPHLFTCVLTEEAPHITSPRWGYLRDVMVPYSNLPQIAHGKLKLVVPFNLVGMASARLSLDRVISSWDFRLLKGI